MPFALRIAWPILALLPLCAVAEALDCAPGQRPVFSCATKARVIVVCASRDLTAQAGFVQYRFGRPAALELAYPAVDADWRPQVRGGTLMLSGGGGAYIAFTNAPYRYTVYTATGRGWGSKAGVLVEKDGKQVANLACRRRPVSELGPDFFASAGIEASSEGFQLP